MKESKEQEVEWSEAQRIAVSVDLLQAAKQLLEFLATIDRNRHFYEGPVLYYAVYRYQKCWLPLLAKQAELDVLEGPLVVPLDCEWIWHCHRLNPTRYKADCEQRYGRILDNSNVASTILGTCSKQTEEIWTRMYPDESFKLDLSGICPKIDAVNKLAHTQTSIDYDLVSAVKRQSTFFYQVSRPFVSNDLFLNEAVARYKGFLHLIKRNKERCTMEFCVPTYDIDLIWHAHQLHPTFYCKDTTTICGEVLVHDDTDSDITEGDKLGVSFMETTKQWEQVYGHRYWRAGAMYRGLAPSSPLAADAHLLKDIPTDVVSDKECDNIIQIPKKTLIEVLLEIVQVKGLPEGSKDNLVVLFSKVQKNTLRTTVKKLTIASESGKKQVVNFLCEPTAELVFELMLTSSSRETRKASSVSLGSTTISVTKVVNSEQGLSTDTWLVVSPSTQIATMKPISLRISFSFTPPFRAPYLVNMVPSQGLDGSHTSVVDEDGNQLIELYIRQGKSGQKQVVGILDSGEARILANNGRKGWSLVDSSFDLCSQNEPSNQGSLYGLIGHRKVLIIPGIKSDYEVECKQQDDDHNFITAVEFSSLNPYGKAVALFNLKNGYLEIKEDWFLSPGIISAYILWDTMISKSGFSSIEMCRWDKNQAFKHEIAIRCDGDCSSGVSSGGARCLSRKCSGGHCGGSCGTGPHNGGAHCLLGYDEAAHYLSGYNGGAHCLSGYDAGRSRDSCGTGAYNGGAHCLSGYDELHCGGSCGTGAQNLGGPCIVGKSSGGGSRESGARCGGGRCGGSCRGYPCN